MKRKRIIRFFMISAVLFLLCYVVLSLFTIQTVTIEGVPAHVSIDTYSFPNNLLFFPSEQVRKELLTSYPQFSDVTLIKKYPSTLIIHFTPRIPIARLMTDSRSLAIDSNGLVLGDSTDEKLPALYVSTLELHTGQQAVGQSITTSLAFLSVMGQDGHIETIRMAEQNTLLVKTAEMIILLDQNSNGSQRAHTLQDLLSGFRIRGTRPKVVDLRFEKPVISF
jgi:cell division septal protein FtsQ